MTLEASMGGYQHYEIPLKRKPDLHALFLKFLLTFPSFSSGWFSKTDDKPYDDDPLERHFTSLEKAKHLLTVVEEDKRICMGLDFDSGLSLEIYLLEPCSEQPWWEVDVSFFPEIKDTKADKLAFQNFVEKHLGFIQQFVEESGNLGSFEESLTPRVELKSKLTYDDFGAFILAMGGEWEYFEDYPPASQGVLKDGESLIGIDYTEEWVKYSSDEQLNLEINWIEGPNPNPLIQRFVKAAVSKWGGVPKNLDDFL